MDPRFKNWLIQQHKNMTPEQKQKFFSVFKHKPQLAVEIISKNLMEWGTSAVFELGTSSAIYDTQLESAELVECFKEHFAKELDGV